MVQYIQKCVFDMTKRNILARVLVKTFRRRLFWTENIFNSNCIGRKRDVLYDGRVTMQLAFFRSFQLFFGFFFSLNASNLPLDVDSICKLEWVGWWGRWILCSLQLDVILRERERIWASSGPSRNLYNSFGCHVLHFFYCRFLDWIWHLPSMKQCQCLPIAIETWAHTTKNPSLIHLKLKITDAIPSRLYLLWASYTQHKHTHTRSFPFENLMSVSCVFSQRNPGATELFMLKWHAKWKYS